MTKRKLKKQTQANSACDCSCREEDYMKWFKHFTNEQPEQELLGVMDRHGTNAYYVYYATHEVYGQQFNDSEEDMSVTVSFAWFKSQLMHIDEVALTGILQELNDVGIILSEKHDGKITITIPGFMDKASNWTKRKYSKKEKEGTCDPPLSARQSDDGDPSVGPPALEKNRIELKGTEKETTLVRDVIDYLNEKAGTTYKHSARESINHIKARAREGAVLEDFKLVIDTKVKDWSGEAKMIRYLRPSTLFNSEKFWGYVNTAKLTVQSSGSGSGYRGSGVAI